MEKAKFKAGKMVLVEYRPANGGGYHGGMWAEDDLPALFARLREKGVKNVFVDDEEVLV